MKYLGKDPARILWRLCNVLASLANRSGISSLPILGRALETGWAALKHSLFRRLAGPEIKVNGCTLLVGPPPFSAGLELAYGQYERGTTQLFKRIVKPGMNVADIGAHIGYYTLLAAKLVGEEGKAYAFEPFPENFALLAKNVEINGFRNVRLVQRAIVGSSGERDLFLSQGASGSHSIFPGKSRSSRTVSVPVTTLDEFLAQEGWPRIDLIKMDIEGAELAALSGMSHLLRRSSRMIIITEFSPIHLGQAGASPLQFLSTIQELGFRIRVIRDQAELQSLDAPLLIRELQGEGNVNLLCERA